MIIDYISPSLSWLSPFLEEVKHLVPMEKLKRITAKVPAKSLKQNQRCHGIINHYKFYKSYKITLYTSFIDLEKVHPKAVLSIKPYSTVDTLCFLAHELSHMVHWDHTPAHKKLEAEIILIFMRKLEQLGYVSEEHEKEISYYAGCKK